MHHISRVGPLALLTVALGACSDASTAAHSYRGGHTALSLSALPVPSPSATAVLSSSGLSLDHVRVVVIRPAADTLADTSIAFTVADTAVTADLSVDAAVGEQLTAAVEYLSAGTVLYAGSLVVTTHAADRPAAGASPSIALRYVGPGATAKKISVAPDSGTFLATTPIQFSAVAIDSSGASLGPAPVVWTISDTTLGRMSVDGVFTPSGKRGSEVVSARGLNGATGQGAIGLLSPAAKLVVMSGGGQTGQVGHALPQLFAVQVQAADGVPVPGQPVAFVASGGSLSPVSVISDATGLAQATMTLGVTPGTYTFTAVVGSFAASATDTAVVGPAAQVVFKQQPTSNVASTALSPAISVQVQDAFGNVVPTAANAVTLSLDPATATNGAVLGGTLTQAAVKGVATFADITVDRTGLAYQLVASSGTLTGSTSKPFDIRPGPLTLSAVGGTTFTMTAGQTPVNAPSVRVTDATGAIVGSVTLHIVARQGTTVLREGDVTSDSSGVFSSWSDVVTTAGTCTVDVSNPNLSGSPLTFTITVLPAAPTRYLLSVSNMRPTAGSSVTVTAALVDDYGNAVAQGGNVVSWSVVNGGSFSSATSTTGQDGRATVTFTAPSQAGVNPVLSAADGTYAGNYYDLVTVAP